jgi:rhodanese-related sulfurtransferase
MYRLVCCLAIACVGAAQAPAPPKPEGSQRPNIFSAVLADSGKTPEVSTEELIKILTDGSATVFDSRPVQEFAMGHIPGAKNVSAKPNVPVSQYVSDVAEIGRIAKDKGLPLVLYCNGPFCGKSKRLTEELVAAGYTNVHRYQLGIPVWRALGGVTQIEIEGARRVRSEDRTAVWIDVRTPAEFASGSVPEAKNIPRALVQVGKDVGELKKAKDDKRLPVFDHNTRIIVFGASAQDARFVAEQIAREAFHNIAF